MNQNEIKRMVVKASYEARACHIGSALSCVSILLDIFKKLKPKDKFIFSKASGVATYYAILSKLGFFPEEKLVYYLKNYPLPNNNVPGVIFSGGSLGHGLPVAVGMAIADRKRNVYVLLGDAEIQEGTTWESLIFAAHHNLKNLKVYVDRNNLQACGGTEDICTLNEPLKKLNEIYPINVIDTIKGDGVDFMENNYEWHYKNLDENQYKAAILQLSK